MEIYYNSTFNNNRRSERLISINRIFGHCISSFSGNFMNFAVTIAFYAVIQKELGQPLYFPGNQKSWDRISDHSTASNNAQFQLWAVLNENIEHEIFNIANGDFVRLRDLWPKIENYFGFEHHEQVLQENEAQLKLAEYMPKNRHVWIRLAEREHLETNAFDYATWSFAGTNNERIISNIDFFCLFQMVHFARQMIVMAILVKLVNSVGQRLSIHSMVMLNASIV